MHASARVLALRVLIFRGLAMIAALLPSLAWALAPNTAKSAPMHRIANESACAGALLALVSSQGCLASVYLATPLRIAAKDAACRRDVGKNAHCARG